MNRLAGIPEPRVVTDSHWPQSADDALAGPPSLPGFVGSSFSPLVAAVADGCLRPVFGEPPLRQGERTGIVLVSRTGDRAGAEHVRAAVADGKRVGPLYFFQSVPNSVAGYVAARWGLRGPVVCLSPTTDARRTGLDQAALLIADGDADHVLVVLVEQAAAGDTAVALLVSGGDPS
ncbi:beta-ketoacyl synthase-like protein [Kribbella orskensis]|uniref:Beta-ketoacyl synthase-like protein n=1 Tax=Kribbella orskensis TaxID=2512216 RepID=A0ABY2BHX0_9ACTN|nr:beta-ketoacyl synthase-like protein [Kribbella sp. VKM Ac-2500]TCO20904.1 beta-ketoacyl synthase-like protein [Kribbella orskensis]